MIPSIGKVNVKEEVFKVKNFSDFTYKTFSAYAKENAIISGPRIIYSGGKLKEGLKPLKIYNIYGKLGVYCNDGKIYFPNEEFIKKYDISPIYQIPKIFPINYERKKSVGITAEHGGYIINDTFAYVGIPKAEHYAVYHGTLFCADGRKIIVCKSQDQTGFNVDVYKDSCVMTDACLGSVKKLLPMDSGLYVFCLRGVAVIKFSSDEMGFYMEKLSFPTIKIVEGSVAKVRDKIFFLSNDGLYYFDGKIFTKIKSALDGKSYAIVGEAVCKDDVYILPVKLDGNSEFYCYDQCVHADTFISSHNLFLADNGITFSPSLGRGDLVENASGVCEWQSIKMDFNTPCEKTLRAVFIDTENRVQITLYSNMGEKRFVIEAGKNVIPLNLTSKEFWIKATCEKEMRLNALKFKYRIK